MRFVKNNYFWSRSKIFFEHVNSYVHSFKNNIYVFNRVSLSNEWFIKKINQTVKIVFRFLISTLKYFNRWSAILSRIRRDFNNFINSEFFLNEIVYEFSSIQAMNLWKFFTNQSAFVVVDNFSLKNNRLITRQKIVDIIIFAQMNVKFHYDRKHQFMFMKQEDYALIKLHKKYNISSIINRKYNQQFVKFFLITKKIERFAYRFVISNNWRIHSVFSVTQLKLYFSSTTNSFSKSRSNQSNFVYVDDDIKNVKSFELFKIINKRQIKIRNTKYFVQWKDYESKHDAWKNLFELKNAMKLINQYENVNCTTITLFERLQLSSILFNKSSSNQKRLIDFKSSSSVIMQKSFKKQKLLTTSKSSTSSTTMQKSFKKQKFLTASKSSTFFSTKFAVSITKSFVALITKFFATFVSIEKFFAIVISSSSIFDFEKFFFIALIRS